MILIDVNVLACAHRPDTADHARYRQWLESAVKSPAGYGMADLVFSRFLRAVTHPRVFRNPTPITTALEFVADIRERTNGVPIAPGHRHSELFTNLCRNAAVTGSLVPDAYLAALAIESESEWITTDRDYARFPGLRWRHALGE